MSSPLPDRINTFGQDLLRRCGRRVHKLAINAGFTCPNRDGSKGRGGCTFCNNVSFSPNARQQPDIAAQIAAGRSVVARRTGARRFIAYFQAYTNTYADLVSLRQLYGAALVELVRRDTHQGSALGSARPTQEAQAWNSSVRQETSSR